ncbi:hypothetical protein [Aeromonas veronii]|uniref:H-NS family histone-like protein n=1 Tax=Aeromonas veronii TaxID=654 RepID=UPI003D210473
MSVEEIIKVITSQRRVRPLARELGYDAFSAVIDTFIAVQDEMKEEYDREQREAAAKKAELEKVLNSIPEDLRASVVAALSGSVQAEGAPKARGPRGPSAVHTVKVGDKVLQVAMAGKVNDELKAVMEAQGFTTKQRKEFVEKFKV